MTTKAPTKASSTKAAAKAGQPISAKAPGKAVAVVTPTEKSLFTKAKATAITKRIGQGIEDTLKLITQAYEGRIWLALGHKSWDEWREKEFGGTYPLALPVVQRKAAVAKLATQAGMSTRAIAAVTGTSQRTAANDAAEGRLSNSCSSMVPTSRSSTARLSTPSRR